MKNVIVDTGRKRYPIYIKAGASDATGSLAAEITGITKALLITDDNVDRMYSRRIIDSLEGEGFSLSKCVILNGEGSKNIENYIKILTALSKNKISRNDTVFALGGGMVGDIAGFAAATYLRGIRFVQIPTTLLAMVDSSAGGKTAINFDSGKNQIGAFFQPDLVICDPDFISSLPDEIFRDGCAEVIKYGVIADGRLFKMLKGPAMRQMEGIIERCLMIKSRLVYEDEFDLGRRQLLNFGHTFGHAIEKCSNYSVTHGKAVAVGMVMAAAAAEVLGICSSDCYRDIKEMVSAFGLPCKTDIAEGELFDAMFSDKKRSLKEITLVLPEEIGRCILKKIPVAELGSFVRFAMKDKEMTSAYRSCFS
ncbi:MAG: 3-dehydroquinate synthase [Synergistaceae bacterium]|nr:3-dehydroquinate synthase [Synergistaceae bacterium]